MNWYNFKTYNVSTGKNNVKKPQGLGKISEITLNPTWYQHKIL